MGRRKRFVLDACISAMGRFRTFGLRERVHLLRAQRD